MKVYQFSFGWRAVFPGDWEQEYNEQTKEIMFSPENSDLVFRLSMVHVADKQGNPAPEEVMEDALKHILPRSNKSLGANDLKLEGLKMRSSVLTEDENGEPDLRIIVGFYCPGELLVIHITGSDEQEIMKSTTFLRLISRAEETAEAKQ